jgi:hypothetical protein
MTDMNGNKMMRDFKIDFALQRHIWVVLNSLLLCKYPIRDLKRANSTGPPVPLRHSLTGRGMHLPINSQSIFI